MRRGDWPENFSKWMERLEIAFGMVLIGIIVLFLLVCGEYSNRLLDNRWLMIFVIGIDLIVGGLYLAFRRKEKVEGIKWPVLRLAGIYAFLFLLQMIWINHVYFYMGWDAGAMRFWVESVVNGSSLAECDALLGYSIYPNNLLLFYIFYLIEKVGTYISVNNPYLLCIYGAGLSVNLSCFLGHLIVRKLIKSRVIHCIYFLIVICWILSSPWSIVAYSDAYGMFFVLLGMWGLLACDRKYVKWVIVTFATIIGYYIKPTAIFPLFVTYLVYGIRYLFCLRERWRELAVLVVSTISFWLIGLCIPLWIQHTFSFRLIPELRMTYHHYLMMGINETSRGSYSHDDYEFSRYQPNVETRKRADMEVFWSRWDTLMEEGRLGWLTAQKAQINFNNGSFAWDRDGVFFIEGEEHDNFLADWFASIMKIGGQYYSTYLTLMQVIWLQVLCGILFVGSGSKENRTEKSCMMLAVCGLIIFLMLFEARARYLYLYSPVFLILSLCGYEAVYSKVAELLEKLHTKRSNRRGYKN